MDERTPTPSASAQPSAYSRRRLLALGGATTAAALLGVRLLEGPTSAQEVQVAATPVALGPKVPPELNEKGAWPVEGKNLAMTRFADESKISSSTVNTLGAAWSFPLDAASGFGAITSNPIVLGNVVYVQDMLSNVMAIDADSGKQIWRTDFKTTTEGPNGIALGYGLVVSVLGDTSEVVALDATNGKLKWRTKLSSNIGEGVDMAPLVYDNTVYVSTVPGNSKAFYRGGQKGIFYALDVSSGDVIWQWDTTVDNLWGNARVNSGGGLWHPPAIDGDDMLYLGIANPGPWPGNSEFPNGSSRPGDNLYTNSLVKLDPKTGSVVWYVQIVPHDLYDLDNQLSPVLTTVKIGGSDTDIVVTSGKHGQVVAVTSDGQELWRTPIGKHENDSLKAIPAGKTIEEYPSSLGGVETPFAVANGVGYFATMNLPRYYTSTGKSTTVTAVPINEATGEIVAIDLATGKIVWDVEVPTAPFAGTTVAGDLVFAGGLDGVLRALSVTDGTIVWTWQAPAGLNAPPAIVGDYIFLPAGTALLASKDTASPAPTPATGVIALKLGEGKAATPAS